MLDAEAIKAIAADEMSVLIVFLLSPWAKGGKLDPHLALPVEGWQ